MPALRGSGGVGGRHDHALAAAERQVGHGGLVGHGARQAQDVAHAPGARRRSPTCGSRRATAPRAVEWMATIVNRPERRPRRTSSSSWSSVSRYAVDRLPVIVSTAIVRAVRPAVAGSLAGLIEPWTSPGSTVTSDLPVELVEPVEPVSRRAGRAMLELLELLESCRRRRAGRRCPGAGAGAAGRSHAGRGRRRRSRRGRGMRVPAVAVVAAVSGAGPGDVRRRSGSRSASAVELEGAAGWRRRSRRRAAVQVVPLVGATSDSGRPRTELWRSWRGDVRWRRRAGRGGGFDAVCVAELLASTSVAAGDVRRRCSCRPTTPDASATASPRWWPGVRWRGPVVVAGVVRTWRCRCAGARCAPPAVTTAAARSVDDVAARGTPTPAAAPPPAKRPAAVAVRRGAAAARCARAAPPPPAPPSPSSFAITPIGPIAGTSPASCAAHAAHVGAELAAGRAVTHVPPCRPLARTPRS